MCSHQIFLSYYLKLEYTYGHILPLTTYVRKDTTETNTHGYTTYSYMRIYLCLEFGIGVLEWSRCGARKWNR